MFPGHNAITWRMAFQDAGDGTDFPDMRAIRALRLVALASWFGTWHGTYREAGESRCFGAGPPLYNPVVPKLRSRGDQGALTFTNSNDRRLHKCNTVICKVELSTRRLPWPTSLDSYEVGKRFPSSSVYLCSLVVGGGFVLCEGFVLCDSTPESPHLTCRWVSGCGARTSRGVEPAGRDLAP